MFRPVETPNREQEKGCRMRMSPNSTYTWIRDTDSDKRRVTYAPLWCYTAHIHILMEYIRRDGILYYTVYPMKLVSSIFYRFSWGSQQWYNNVRLMLTEALQSRFQNHSKTQNNQTSTVVWSQMIVEWQVYFQVSRFIYYLNHISCISNATLQVSKNHLWLALCVIVFFVEIHLMLYV